VIGRGSSHGITAPAAMQPERKLTAILTSGYDDGRQWSSGLSPAQATAVLV
jgi:hypothetical protein